MVVSSPGAVQRAHLVSSPRRVKVHVSMMAQKNRNKKCQKRVQTFFSKKFFFDPKFSKNLYSWSFLVKNSINLVSLQSSIGVGMRSMQGRTLGVARCGGRHTIVIYGVAKIAFCHTIKSKIF